MGMMTRQMGQQGDNGKKGQRERGGGGREDTPQPGHDNDPHVIQRPLRNFHLHQKFLIINTIHEGASHNGFFVGCDDFLEACAHQVGI
jgi:hypothetical protein